MEIRSFIAVDPSAEVAERLSAVVQRLSRETKGFKWVGPGGIHLTLRFLGEVEEAVLAKVQERIAGVAQNFEPMALRARGVGFFPSAQRPRIVWVGLEGDTDRLSNLQSEIETSLEGLDVHREEKRPFTPHLTIARVRDPHLAVGVARILQAAKEADCGAFVARSLILYKSRLTPQGSEYSKLGEFNFKE